jgi:hypothetical protein
MDPGINVAFQQVSLTLISSFTQGEFLDSMPWHFPLISLVTFGLHPRYVVRVATLFCQRTRHFISTSPVLSSWVSPPARWS